MALGVDVRVDAQRDARPPALGARRGVDALELAVRLGVDRLEAQADRLGDLARTLADPGEDDLVRPEAGPQRHLDLAERVGVGAGAEALHELDEAERRVGFEGVVDRVRAARQGRAQAVEPLADGGGGIDVGGSSRGAGNGRERHAVTRPGAVPQGETGRHEAEL